MQAIGFVLEHKLAEESLAEARRAAYIRVRLHGVRQLIVDHSMPPAVWVVTDVAWYRCESFLPQFGMAAVCKKQLS